MNVYLKKLNDEYDEHAGRLQIAEDGQVNGRDVAGVDGHEYVDHVVGVDDVDGGGLAAIRGAEGRRGKGALIARKALTVLIVVLDVELVELFAHLGRIGRLGRRRRVNINALLLLYFLILLLLTLEVLHAPLLGQIPEATPHRHTEQHVAHVVEADADGAHNLVEVGLMPAEAAAVPEEAARVRARRHAARAAEEAAKVAAHSLREALVGEEATLAAPLALHDELALEHELVARRLALALYLGVEGGAEVVLELEHDVLVEASRAQRRVQHEQEEEREGQVDKVLEHVVLGERQTHVLGHALLLELLDVLEADDVVREQHLDEHERHGEYEQDGVGEVLGVEEGKEATQLLEQRALDRVHVHGRLLLGVRRCFSTALEC